MFKDAPAFSSFSVGDIGRAREFYGQTLGLPVAEAFGLLKIKLAGGQEIEIYPKPDHAPASFTVLNFQVPDINQAVSALSAAGVEIETYDLPELKTGDNGILVDEKMQLKAAWFKDPSGNILSVIEGEMT